MSSRYRSLIKDTFIFALGSFGSKLILFLMVPLYTNYMAEAEYGTADLVFTIAQLLAPFISVVIFDAVIRFGLSKNEKKENVLLVGVIVFIFSVVIGAIITPLIGLYRTVSEWKWYLYTYVICNIANSIELNYLKAKGKNKIYALLSILQTGLMASLNVWFLVYRSLGIRGYLLAYILSNLTIDVLAFIAGKVGSDLTKAKFDKRLFREMVLYSTPLILNNVSWWVIHSSDKVMVEIMISTAALGIYTAAAKIPALINVMVTVFQQAWGISAVREIESTNDSKYYSDVFKFLFLFISGACITFVTIMKVFMHFYVGEGFQEAWQYVPLLLVSAVFASIASYFGSMYGALKKSVNNMLSTALAAVVNLVVNWIFIPVVGIWGAVIGTVVSYTVVAFVRMIDVRRYINIPINWKTLLSNCFIIVIQAIMVSRDFHIYTVSIITMFIFVIVNWGDLRLMLVRINGTVRDITKR